MAGTLAANGNAHVKTGTVRYCRALSGYVKDKKGEMFAFSILMNNHIMPARAMGSIQDAIVEKIAEQE
jgi:D-alanyl-D-alanine carboxypeptidase